jgi:hypothetical protein
MNNNEIDSYADKRLIASIINQAIVDGEKIKRPKSLKIVSKKLKKLSINKRILRRSLILIMNFICENLIEFYLKIEFLNIIVKLIKHNESMKNKYENHFLTIEARLFFNKENKLFCFYCYLLDIDPVYLAEKSKKYFSLYDRNKIKKKILIKEPSSILL